jgi:HlyD family secretion protein
MSEASRRIVDVDNVKPYRSPKQRRQVLIAIVVVLIVAGVGAGAYLFLAPKKQTYVLRSFETAKVQTGSLVQTTQASGTVAVPVQMNLPSPEEGYAAALYVAEGDTVVKGQVLARLDVPDLRTSVEDQQSALQDAKRTYDKTVAQNRINVERKQRSIASLAADVADAGVERDRLKKLVSINSSRQSELDAAQKALDKQIASKKEQELQLQEDQRLYALDEQTRLAAIADLETKISRLMERIRATAISSPMNGEVLDIDSTLGVPGSRVANSKTLFTIADPASAIAELEVAEQYSGLLSLGQSVKLTVGSTTMTGRITSIGKVAQQSSDGLGATVSVKVKPEGDTGSALLLGNTAVGELDLGVKENAMTIPRGPYLTTGSQRYLYKVQGSIAKRVAVTFGLMEGNTVEILSGVESGDEVITSGYQNFVEYEEITLERGGRS